MRNLAQELLDISRALEEREKYLLRLAHTAEIGAAIVAAASALPIEGLVVWLPLLSGPLIIAGAIARISAGELRVPTRVSRRAALRATATANIDHDEITASMLEYKIHLRHVKPRELPESRVSRFYGHKCKTPSWRLGELYASSAFYSSRLLKKEAWRTLVAVAGLLAVGLATTYLVASLNQSLEDKLRITVLAGGGTVFLAVCSLWSIDARRLFHSSARIGEIFNRFCAAQESSSFSHLATWYDLERTHGPLVRTSRYQHARENLEQAWVEFAASFARREEESLKE